MKKSILLSTLLLWSCSDFEIFPESHIPEELRPIVDEFVSQAEQHGRKVKGMYTRLEFKYEVDMSKRGMLGYCDTHGRQITITLDDWYIHFMLKYHPQRAYTLVFHEMGHSFLHRKDTDKPKSIMNAQYVQTDDWMSMIDELFSGD